MIQGPAEGVISPAGPVGLAPKKADARKEALRKEVPPSAFVISRNDWIVGKSIILEDYKMEKYIYNEKNRLWYELQGDYYLPCLKLPSVPADAFFIAAAFQF